MFENNTIVITNNKNNILSNNKELKYIKVYSFKEFIKLYYFDYNYSAIKYIMDKYNVIYEIAKIYLNNLIYIEDKKYNSNKLNFLSSLKKELDNNNLLIYNKLFKEYLKNKNIVFYNIPDTKEKNLIIKELNNNSKVEELNNYSNNYTHKIYELSSLEEEVLFIIDKIIDLVNNKIDINKIFITNIDSDYKKAIRRLFPMFNIPVSLTNDEYIYGTFLVTEFLKHYDSNINNTLEHIKEYVNTEEEIIIYKKILEIVNSFAFIDDFLEIKDIIRTKLKNTKIPSITLENSIREVDISYELKDDEYLFISSFNQGIIPNIYKDEGYLNDKELEELNISTTPDKNNISRQELINNLNNKKNLIISYKLLSNGEEYRISNINEELNYEIINNYKINLNISNKYNKILLTSLLDEYNKFGTIKDDLLILNKHYKNLEYNTYDNKYKGIDSNTIKDYLNNQITLSYSSLNNYYKCPFIYYIENILKLNIYEESFNQKIGNLFHRILEQYNKTELTYEELWNKEIANLENLTFKELFFLNRLKKELEFVIETLKKQETLTNLHEELHEEKIVISDSKNTTITFKGFIDKIKYKKDKDKTIIAIIDYKTGNADSDLTLLPYGLNMQLPIYLYLAKNSNKFTNVEVAGFYLQRVLNDETTVGNNASYEQEKYKNLMLQGYSNEDFNILSEFDTTYQDSKLLKSIKVKTDGTFYEYSKSRILSTKEMNKVEELVREKIEEGANNILDANFTIAPKKIENNNYGCSYCKYKDICYRKNEDIVELKKLERKDVLGGDDNELD